MANTQHNKRPKVVLFDIGGVVVLSPMKAILEYERAHSLPLGWINTCISSTAPNGAWQRIERGEIPLDDAWFALWKQDLENPRPGLWAKYWLKSNPSKSPSDVPSAPQIDAKPLFWTMMRNARDPDPHIFPMLLKLRERMKDTDPPLILAALSNTTQFPPGIKDETGTIYTPGMRLRAKEEDKSTRTPPSHIFPPARSSNDLRQIRPVQANFDIFLSSAHLGMRKPEPRIYEHALSELDQFARSRGDKYGVQPGDILFLDDIGQNLSQARQQGWRTIKVRMGRTEEAVKEVDEILGWKLRGQGAKL